MDLKDIATMKSISKSFAHMPHTCTFPITIIGACGAELACSTCHLIFEQDLFDKLPEMTEEEEDMLDLAFEVTDT